MIFQSKNENGVLKADWMIKQPIGATVLTRRTSKLTDKDMLTGQTLEGYIAQGLRGNFFPEKYKIGKEKCVQRKRCGVKLLNCGKTEKEHINIEKEWVDCSEDNSCTTVLYKITGGMWHSSWLKEQLKSGEPIFMSKDKRLQKEARLEGYETVKGWLDFYPNYTPPIDINKTWRIKMERIK